MSQNKQQGPTKQELKIFGILAGIGAIYYCAVTYTFVFIAILTLILVSLAILWIKVPKFQAWAKSRFQRKPKAENGSKPARPIKGMGCPVCGQPMAEISSLKNAFYCFKCQKIQTK